MIQYLTKLQEVADTVEAERGPFTLFGLFMREDSPGRWDLVVSAPWLEEGKLKAVGEFVEVLATAIGEEAMQSFSRIVTLNRDDPALKAILDEVGKASLPFLKQGRNLFGLPIEDAYILRARHKEPSPSKRMQRVSAARRGRRAASR